MKITLKHIKPVYETLELVVSDDHGVTYNGGERFTEPRDIYNLLKPYSDETKEYFFAFHLDGKNRITCLEIVSVGSLNQSIVHPREVFKTALLSSAACIILAHNHPTGDPTPSREDREITRRLCEAGELLGVKVLDHVIIGGGCYLSFANEGLMS